MLGWCYEKDAAAVVDWMPGMVTLCFSNERSVFVSHSRGGNLPQPLVSIHDRWRPSASGAMEGAKGCRASFR